MAGGMNKRGSFRVPMAERVARTERVALTERVAECPVRHCWVYDASGRRVPGLLVEWRRGRAGESQARVVRVVGVRLAQWAVVEEWLPADRVHPADGVHPAGPSDGRPGP